MAQGTTKGVPIDIDGTLSNNSDLLVASQKATKTYVDNGLLLKQNTIGYTPVNKGGDTMLGNLILNANPTLPLQAATKDYIDTLINGIDWKQAATAGTVSALPTYAVTGSGQILTGTSNGAIPSATTDGVTLVVGNRLLVKNETSTLAPNNGIYVVTQAGSGSLPFILTRSDDANTPSEIAEATLSINGGSTLSNTQWHCNPASVPVVIGTTNITFAQIGSGTYSAGSGLSLTSNVFSVATNGVTDSMIQSSANWNTAYTNRITSLTTTGSSGSATLSSNTLNIPNYTLAGLGGISLTSLSSTATGLTYTNTTGVFSLTSGYVIPTTSSATNWDTAYTNRITSATSPLSITSNAISISQATSSVSGYLSNTDWTTFNNKQSTITLTTTGTSGSSTFSSNTLNIPQYQSQLTLTTTGSTGVSTLVGSTLNIPNYNNITDGVVSGGVVTWSGSGLVFNISACNYYINGVNYSSASASKTLTTADPTNARIDVFAVNTSGQVVVITGTPSSNPQKPQVDPATQLELTTVIVNAGATIPNGVTSQIVYDENVETNWTKTNGGFSSVNYAYTTAPFKNTYSIQGVCGSLLNNLIFTCVPALDYSNYSTIIFAVKLTRALYTTNPEYVSLEFLTTGNVRIGNLLKLDNTNQYGFDYTSTSWQLITVPLSQLNITTGTIVALRFVLSQYTVNIPFTYQTVYFDRIELQAGISQSPTTANSFGKVSTGSGSAIATIPTDTLNVVASGLASVSATAKTLTIAVPLTLTTTGTSGVATLVGSTLNIPQYSGGMAIGGSITSATQGSVLFAGASGVLAQNNSNFFWDNTNNYLGIGTTSPVSVLTVTTSSTATPRGLTLHQTSSDTNAALLTMRKSRGAAAAINGDNIGNWFADAYDGTQYTSGGRIRFSIDGAVSNGVVPTSFQIFTGSSGTGTERARITSAGRLLIGTTTESTYILDVLGTSRLTGQLTVTGSTTAASAIARGAYYTPTLVAAANGDVLVGLDVAPTFTLGAFTGTSSYAARFQETILVSKNQNGSTGINITNTTNGALSQSFVYFQSDAIAGDLTIGKRSNFATAAIAAYDSYIANSTNGNITIQNSFASGGIRFAAGGSTTAQLTLSSAGALSQTVNQNAATAFTVSNTTSGTASESKLILTSDASSGSAVFGKYSTTTTTNKIITNNDAYIYNATAGDISILNDFASGSIIMASGGSSTAHVTIGTTGLTTFATGVDYKRLNPTTVTVASTANLTPDISAGDTFTITGQTVSLSVANPTGTPVNGQKMTIRITGTAARAITWSGSQYRASTDLPLPTTTITTKTLYLGFMYNSAGTGTWDLLALLNNF